MTSEFRVYVRLVIKDDQKVSQIRQIQAGIPSEFVSQDVEEFTLQLVMRMKFSQVQEFGIIPLFKESSLQDFGRIVTDDSVVGNAIALFQGQSQWQHLSIYAVELDIEPSVENAQKLLSLR